MKKSVWWVVATISVSLFFVYACEENPTSPAGETDTNQTDTSDTTTDTTTDTTGNQNPVGPTTYWEADSYSAVCGSYDGDDFMPLNLTYPTAGDSFKIGDTIVLGICYEPEEGRLAGETVTLIREEEDGTKSALEIASLAEDDMSEKEIQEMDNGKLTWIIPESFPEEEGGTSVIGDSLYLVLRTYVGMFPSQEEYGPFSITE